MSSSPDPERVREALANEGIVYRVLDGHHEDWKVAHEAVLVYAEVAELWLAGSSPDYEAAWAKYAEIQGQDRLWLSRWEVRAVVDAAFPNREGGSPQ